MQRYQWYRHVSRVLVSVVVDFLLILPKLEGVLYIACYSIQIICFYRNWIYYSVHDLTIALWNLQNFQMRRMHITES